MRSTGNDDDQIVWTKDVSIKNGEPSEVRKVFLSRIESFKSEVLEEVFRILGEKQGFVRLDFYTELDPLKF